MKVGIHFNKLPNEIRLKIFRMILKRLPHSKATASDFLVLFWDLALMTLHVEKKRLDNMPVHLGKKPAPHVWNLFIGTESKFCEKLVYENGRVWYAPSSCEEGTPMWEVNRWLVTFLYYNYFPFTKDIDFADYVVVTKDLTAVMRHKIHLPFVRNRWHPPVLRIFYWGHHPTTWKYISPEVFNSLTDQELVTVLCRRNSFKGCGKNMRKNIVNRVIQHVNDLPKEEEEGQVYTLVHYDATNLCELLPVNDTIVICPFKLRHVGNFGIHNFHLNEYSARAFGCVIAEASSELRILDFIDEMTKIKRKLHLCRDHVQTFCRTNGLNPRIIYEAVPFIGYATGLASQEEAVTALMNSNMPTLRYVKSLVTKKRKPISKMSLQLVELDFQFYSEKLVSFVEAQHSTCAELYRKALDYMIL